MGKRRTVDPRISAVRRAAGRRGAAARWGVTDLANGGNHLRIKATGSVPTVANPSHATIRSSRTRAQVRAGRTDWYKITNVADDEADLYIYDEIGFWGVTANDLTHELRDLRVTTLNVHINSPGGEVFDGIAIYNALVDHPATVHVRVEGLAASIASVIAMAGDRVVMNRHTQLMIHDPSTFCMGNASDMLETITRLELCADGIAAVYADKAGGTPEEWRERMKATLWLTGEQAVELGLADEVAAAHGVGQAEEDPDEDVPDMAATWDLSIFANAPDQPAPVAPPPTEPEPAPPAEDDPEPDEEPGDTDLFAALRADLDPLGARLAVLARTMKEEAAS